ncbi:hypothetical protein ITJ54_17070 [Curtobacterium sp. VKM Ac-2865]|uniref:hypothetical protein n=1 Tax=Curtobacterium sp. VKM Ac-2865 TaxID=2783817 RepID=UPI00188ACB1A|nr:hypothetical protein [Curtobacterium sp. VKM Ac-2865]MBF4584382.1 hypothetical protein [Curtobacterium sp. VKM Ac-2865]
MSVAVAATIAIGATGCAFFTPQDTKTIKQITDGVNVTAGKIDVRNALLISDSGDDARFVGTLVNNSDSDDITVSMELGGDTQTVEVPANSRVDLAQSSTGTDEAESSVQTGEDTQGTQVVDAREVVFSDAKATPGSLVKVYFSSPGTEGVSASVPVLTSAQEEYQTLAPSPSPTSEFTFPAESPSATPSDSATPNAN